ncbi:MAG: hypothetical protein KIT27_04755 [Legionellales bacterium]|nr:hypothetical protein [Legionellales bacterium]
MIITNLTVLSSPIAEKDPTTQHGFSTIQFLLVMAMLVVIGVMIIRHWQAYEQAQIWREKNQWIGMLIEKSQSSSWAASEDLCQKKQLPLTLCNAVQDHEFFYRRNATALDIIIYQVPPYICTKYQQHWQAYANRCVLEKNNLNMDFHLSVPLENTVKNTKSK